VIRISLITLFVALLSGSASAQQIETIITPGVQWHFGQRTWLHALKPGEMTALQINPHLTAPPKIGTQAELTIYLTNDWDTTGMREFFNILTAKGYGYDRGMQNDHHVRFGMETAFGGKHVPMFFCFEAPEGLAADCPLRIYGGDNANRGVWICRKEGDCKDLLKSLWEPQQTQAAVQVIRIDPTQSFKIEPLR
jgi:hypothetical protein